MSDESIAPAGGADDVVSVPVSNPATENDFSLSVEEATQQLSAWRKKQNPEAEAAPEKAAAEAEPELADEANDAQAEEPDPVEPTKEPEPEAIPPIDPPRSWTKEEKEEFATYPREAQEKIARREQDREATLRRSQNEAAEKLKGLTAKEQQVEQARQQYEAALPALLQTLQEQQQGEFRDVRTMADVEKLAREDWPRYALWDAQQKKIAAVTQEVKASQERQQTEFKTKWNEFAVKEDAAAKEHIPELADPAKASKLAETVMSTVEKVGITRDDFAKAWTGEASISPRDHRWQQIMVKAALYDQAKETASKPAKPNLPPVQRPGVSKAPTNANDAQIQELEKAFARKPDAKNAAALMTARRRNA